MNASFLKHFRIVAAIHIGFVLIFFFVEFIRNYFRDDPPENIPIQFMQLPASATEVESHSLEKSPVAEPEPVVTPEPAPVPEPEPAPVPEPEPAPVPEPKPQSVPELKPVKTSGRIIRREPSVRPPSERQIQKMLSSGLASVESAPVDRERIYFDMIRRRLYSVWVQPSTEEAGDAVVRARIELGSGGRITGGHIIKKSGNPAMDNSVMDTIDAVDNIQGLSEEFIRKHKHVTIVFKVE